MQKFSHDDEIYFNYIKHLEELTEGQQEIVYNFPAYVGAVNLARFLALNEMYSHCLNLSGDIADVGSYKGASLLAFAKLVKIFEPYSNTRVHGFDWFKGMAPSEDDNPIISEKYRSTKATLEKLISLQGFDDFVELHDMDLTASLEPFLEERPWLQFKCVFLDCGVRDVLAACMKYIWPKLVPGGVLILDHFNNPASPQESSIIRECSGGATIRQIPYSRTPTAYIIKSS